MANVPYDLQETTRFFLVAPPTVRVTAPPPTRFVPWHVPAWLPPEIEGSLTFLAFAVLGFGLAFVASGIAAFFRGA